MSHHKKELFVEKLLEQRVLPTYYNSDLEKAKEIAKACVKGGCEVVEFTNRGDRAHEVFKELAAWRDENRPELTLGTGTVIDSKTAALYINNGADYIVGPVSNPKVGEICSRRKVPYVPGCFTPSEISTAERNGANVVKVFPASTLGPKFIRALIKGPTSRSRLMPSGGVKADRENLEGWFKAGASAVNIGSDLVKNDLVKEEDYEAIADRVEKCISMISEIRQEIES